MEEALKRISKLVEEFGVTDVITTEYPHDGVITEFEIPELRGICFSICTVTNPFSGAQRSYMVAYNSNNNDSVAVRPESDGHHRELQRLRREVERLETETENSDNKIKLDEWLGGF